MSTLQVLFIIIANMLNLQVANSNFEILSVSWHVYLVLTSLLIAVCSLLFGVGKK